MNRRLLQLLLVLALLEGGLALRTVGTKGAMVDALSRQQSHTAFRARSLYRSGLDTVPQGTIWRGYGTRPRRGIALLPRAAAWLYRLYGYEWPRAGRLLSALLGVLAAAFLLSAFREGEEGLVAALVVLLSPAAIFVGRSFVPDGFLLFHGAVLVCALRRLLSGKIDGLGLGLAMLAFGGGMLSSPQALFWFLPIAWVLWRSPRASDPAVSPWRICLGLLALIALVAFPVAGWLTLPNRVDLWSLLRGAQWTAWIEAVLVAPWTVAGTLLVLAGLFPGSSSPSEAGLGRSWLLAAMLCSWTWAASATHPDALALLVVPGAICAAAGWRRIATRRSAVGRWCLALALLALAGTTGRGPLELWSKRAWGLWQVEEAAQRLRGCSNRGEEVITSYVGGAELLYLADRPGRHVIPEELDGDCLAEARRNGVAALALMITVPPARIPGFVDPEAMERWIEERDLRGNRCDSQGQGGYFVRRFQNDDPWLNDVELARKGNVAGRIFDSFRRLLGGPEDWIEGMEALDVDFFCLTYPSSEKGPDAVLHRKLSDSPDWGLAHWTDRHLLYLPRRRPYLRHLGRSRLHPLYFQETLAWAREKRAFGDLLAELDERRRLEGSSARIAFLRGCTLAGMGRTIEARRAFEEALELDPRLGDAWNNLAALSLHAGDRANAANCLRRAHALGFPVDRRFVEELGLQELLRRKAETAGKRD